jgi:hypothetical protein
MHYSFFQAVQGQFKHRKDFPNDVDGGGMRSQLPRSMANLTKRNFCDLVTGLGLNLFLVRMMNGAKIDRSQFLREFL